MDSFSLVDSGIRMISEMFSSLRRELMSRMRVFVFEAVVVAVGGVGGGAFVIFVVVVMCGGDPSDSIFVRVNKIMGHSNENNPLSDGG